MPNFPNAMGGSTPVTDQAPVTNALPSMQGSVPDVGAPPAPQVQQAPDPHEAFFSRIGKSLMGQSNQYSVAPDGTLQNNPTPVSGAQMFRAVLGAGLAGMAAGANGNPAQGLVGGIARGAGAGIQQAQQQDQLKQQQAQLDFKDQQTVTQQDRENQLIQAQVANMHSEIAGRQHTSDLQDAEAHAKHNAASAVVLGTLTAAGGTPAIVPINGKAASDFTAPDLAAAYVKDPTILKGPPGFIRHFVDTTDSSELTYNGKNWIDSSGEPVNMTDRTSVKAIDVPVDAMKTTMPTSGKDINTAYGARLVDPDGTYQISPLGMDALFTKHIAASKAHAAVNRDNAASAASLASAARDRVQTGMLQTEKTKQQAQSNAWDELNKAGGDFTKLSPKSQAIIGEAQSSLIPGLNAEYKQIMSEPEPDEARAKQLLLQMDQIRSLSMQALKFGAPAGSKQASSTTPVIPANPEAQAARQSGTPSASQPVQNENQAARQPSNGVPQGNGAHIDDNTAQEFLRLAGGDKNKARLLAQQNGWLF